MFTRKIFCCIALSFLASFALAQSNQSSLAPMLKQALPAIVNIKTDTPTTRRKARQPIETMQGSGVILDAKKGIIVTNAHVVQHALSVTVTLHDGRRFIGHVIGQDKATDLAVIHIEPEKLVTLPYTEDIHIGDFVTAIGSPFGLAQSVSSGIISSVNRHIGIEGIENFIQTDASINPGNSGGALINQHGALIGINTAILSKGHGGNIGIGFAIPMTIVIPIVEQIVAHGNVEHGVLGVIAQDINPTLAEALGSKRTQGAVITHISPKSPAALSDLHKEDILIKINSHRITSANDLRSYIGVHRPNSTISITRLHHGKLNTIQVKLKSTKEITPTKSNFPLAGLRLVNYTELDIAGKVIQGIEVRTVVRGSQAWLSGIHPGDVILSLNRTPLANLAELQEQVKRLKNKQKVLIEVLRQHNTIFLALKT